ncbi:hypothetical protein LPJ71_009605, partial [Coemansia sp. S17]
MRRAVLLVSLVLAGAHASVPTYDAHPYLCANSTMFGSLIEGAAVDRHGSFYAVSYKDDKAAVGQAFTQQKLFFEDLERPNTWFNAVRFNVDRHGVQEAYLGDVTNHRVVRVRDPGGKGQFLHSEVF